MSSSDNELLLTIALLVLGIGLIALLTPSPQQKATWQQRDLNASPERVITSTVSYLQDLGYAIDTIDRANGFVKTQYAGRAQLHGASGVIADILVGEARYAVTVEVRKLRPEVSRVRVNLIAEEWKSGSLFQAGHWSSDPLAYNGTDYDQFFQGLRRALGLIGAVDQVGDRCVASAEFLGALERAMLCG